MKKLSPYLPLAILTVLGMALSRLQAAPPGELLWTFQTDDIIYGAPAIGPGGEVVLGSADGSVYSLNPDGSLRWVFPEANDWIESSPTIARDGTVYAGSWDGSVYALDNVDGSLKWKFETGAFIIASPAIGPDGTVYVGSNDGFLYALYPNGAQKWISTSVGTPGPVNGSPVLSRDGKTVYFGTDNGDLHALDTANGEPRWSFSTTAVHPVIGDQSAAITSAPAVGWDGSLYFGTEKGYLYALDHSGTLRWSYPATDAIRSSPVLTPEGTLLFAAADGYLYALDLEGFQLWEVLVGDVFYCTPAIDAAGNVVLAAYAGSGEIGAATRILGLDSDGTEQWSYLISGYNDSAPNIAPDGSIYIGAHDGVLYKFAGQAGLMPEGWPRVQGNRRQTGFGPDLQDPTLLDYFPAISQSVGGWVKTPWFGAGWLAEDRLPWIRHVDLGLLYLAGPGADSVWFYDPVLGDWFYASAFAPDHYYRLGTGSWLFHLQGTTLDSGRWFYDYQMGDWVTDPQ